MSDGNKAWFGLVAAGVAIELACVAGVVAGDLKEHLEWVIPMGILSTGVSMLAVGAAQRLRCTAQLWWVIVAFAVVFRATWIAATPSLSDDVYRSLWEGRIVCAGENPFALAPSAPELAGLRDEAWAKVNHPEIPAIYPPVAQGVAAVASALGFGSLAAQLAIYKILLALFDLATAIPMARWLRSAGRPPIEAMIWLWNPLVILEFSGQGHNDAIGIFFLVLAGCVLARNALEKPEIEISGSDRASVGAAQIASFSSAGAGEGGQQTANAATHDNSCGTESLSPLSASATLGNTRSHNKFLGKAAILAAAALAFCALSKWFGILAMPLVLARTVPRERWKPALVFCAIVGLGWLPFLGAGLRVTEALQQYGARWEYNAPLYESMRWGFRQVAEWLGPKSALAGTWLAPQGSLEPERAARAVLALGFMILTFWTSRRTDTQRAFGGLTLGALLLLPTVHPWYVAWTIPFIAIAECLAAWVLSATCLLAYATLIAWTTLNRWESPPWMLWLEWLPFAGAVVWSLRRKQA
ncbi:MAG: hypothetical protein JNJ88_16280 [Planctomycetes bacterium]|nr:hypothetical protein [Planctomycetota bacterium]